MNEITLYMDSDCVETVFPYLTANVEITLKHFCDVLEKIVCYGVLNDNCDVEKVHLEATFLDVCFSGARYFEEYEIPVEDFEDFLIAIEEDGGVWDYFFQECIQERFKQL